MLEEVGEQGAVEARGGGGVAAGVAAGGGAEVEDGDKGQTDN